MSIIYTASKQRLIRYDMSNTKKAKPASSTLSRKSHITLQEISFDFSSEIFLFCCII